MSTTGSTKAGAATGGATGDTKMRDAPAIKVPPQVLTMKQLKIATPTPFTGERKKLDTFLLQMTLYFRFNEALFKQEQDKVMYASYYLQGEAEAWFRPYLKDWVQHCDTNPEDADDDTLELFRSFGKFHTAINLVFGDINEQRTAKREICRLKQTKSAADYTAQFKRISVGTNWDDVALVAQYYHGLKDGVKDEISQRERPDKLHAMMLMAV